MRKGWRKESLGDITSLITSGSRGWAEHYSEDGALFIRMTNLPRDGIRLKLDDLKYVNLPASNDEGKRTRLSRGDILISITAELGKIGYVDNSFQEEGYINQHVALVRVNDSRVDTEFLAHLLSSPPYRNKFVQLNDAGAKSGLNLGTISDLLVVLPPLAEQKKIAAILRTWDEAIEKAEDILKKRKHRQKALMLGVFEGLIKRKKSLTEAEAIFDPVTGKKRADLPLLAVTQDQGILPRDQLDRRVVMPEGSIDGYKVVQKGDFVISLRSFEGGLEYSGYTGLISPAYTILRPKKDIDTEFYRFYFKSHSFVGRLSPLVFGIRDGKSIAFRDFGFMEIPNPPIDEQRKISQTLLCFEEEIEVQKRRLDLLKKQKRGLMQKLLTGAWPVRADKEAA